MSPTSPALASGFFIAEPLGKPPTPDTVPVAMHIHGTQNLVSDTFSNERNHDSLEKWLTLVQGWEIHNMCLNYVTLEVREPFKASKQTTVMEVCQKDTTPTRELLGGQR